MVTIYTALHATLVVQIANTYAVRLICIISLKRNKVIIIIMDSERNWTIYRYWDNNTIFFSVHRLRNMWSLNCKCSISSRNQNIKIKLKNMIKCFKLKLPNNWYCLLICLAKDLKNKTITQITKSKFTDKLIKKLMEKFYLDNICWRNIVMLFQFIELTGIIRRYHGNQAWNSCF